TKPSESIVPINCCLPGPRAKKKLRSPTNCSPSPVNRKRKRPGGTLLTCCCAATNSFMWTDLSFVLFPRARLYEPQRAASQTKQLRVADPRSEQKLRRNLHLARFHD